MMNPATLAAGFSALTHERLDEQISTWKASGVGGEIDEKIHQTVSGLIDRCSETDVETIKLMMVAHAQSVVFNILNIFDGTGDLENTEDFGAFTIEFESFKTNKTSKIVPNEQEMLHDLFMESCADILRLKFGGDKK